MGKHINPSFSMTALSAALVLAYGPAYAEDADITALTKPESSVSVGVGNWSKDRAQRGVFDGMRDSGAYGLLDIDISKRNDATGTWLGLKARNLGLDNGELKAEWLRQGDIGASFEYSQIVRDAPYTVNTGLQGINSTTQSVGTIVPGAGVNVVLGTKRDRYTAAFVKHFGKNLRLNASFRNEDKEGTRHYGRGGAAEFAVEPIDSTIRLLETTLSYTSDKLQLSGGYFGSSYSTNNTLIISNRSPFNAANTYNLSQPLDNMAHELFLNGGYNFTPTTRGTFKLSYSRATQDEFLPTSTPGLLFTPGQAPTALTPNHLGGKLETTMAEIGLTAKPLPKLSVLANLRYRDFADKTPVNQYVFDVTPPITNNFVNTPFSYRNIVGKLQGTYRLGQGYSVLGGIEYTTQDRTAPPPFAGTYIRVPFVKQLNTASYRIQMRKSMSETINGTLAYVREDRDGKDYVAAGPSGGPPDLEENLINPMHIADRKRDKVRAMLDWSPAEKLNMQFAVEDSQDKYGNGPNNNPLGIQKGSGSLYSVDATYQIKTDWQVHGWVSRDESKADEITVGDGGDPERKYNTLKETGTAFGVGVKGKFSERLKVGGDIEQYRSINKYIQTYSGGASLSGSLVPTPDITNTMLKIKLFATYAMQKNTELRFDLIHEKWSTDDWSWMNGAGTPFAYCGNNATCTGGGTDGTTVLANPKQESTFLGVRLKYKF